MATTEDVIQLEKILQEDDLGKQIATQYITWESYRQVQKQGWHELLSYIYSTDTNTTSNAANGWKNSTTTPKLTQIADNLVAHYLASLFPNPRWLTWEGSNQEEESKEKVAAIKAYSRWMTEQRETFREPIKNIVWDYVLYGNSFGITDWFDNRVEQPNGAISQGYTGPGVRRISPEDIVFPPTASTFDRAPKIVRSIISLGECKKFLQQLSSTPGEKEAANEIWDYMREYRHKAHNSATNFTYADNVYDIAGFGSFNQYLTSDAVEVLTFYGDYFDKESGEFHENYIVQVIDRHKVVRAEPNPSGLTGPKIRHAGWRPRTDSLWAMGPLENLVGLQYRLDHVENLKADLFDLITFPPLKIVGDVEDFNWAPFEKIYVGSEGDVAPLTTNANPLAANYELDVLKATMEEMAGSPKEAMGFRTPGEKTAYEVQRLENAAGRIFQAKISQFEESFLEPLINDMLNLAREMTDEVSIRALNEYNSAEFLSVTAEDLSGSGRIRPMAARHFIEVSDRVQSIQQFFASVGADPLVKVHWSGVAISKLYEELLDLTPYKLVTPYIGITEQAEAELMQAQAMEDTQMSIGTASGMSPDDYDLDNPDLAGGSNAEQFMG